MNALHQTFATATAFDAGLASDWRNAIRNINEHLVFIPSHRRTIALKDVMVIPGVPLNRPSYVEQARRQLAERLAGYRRDIRRVSEAEQKMDAIGMEYAISSDDWRALGREAV